MNHRILITMFMALSLLSACAGAPEEATPTPAISEPTPTAAPTAMPTETPATTQRRLIYARGVSEYPNIHRYEVYAVEPHGGPRLLFTVSGASSTSAGHVFLLRRSGQMLARVQGSLVAFDLSTGAQTVLYEAPEGYNIYSPAILRRDEALLAFTERKQWESHLYQIKVLDLTTGSATQVFSGNRREKTQGIIGVPMPWAWYKDGQSILLHGLTGTESAPWWGRITVDGSKLETLDFPGGYVSPDGVYSAATGPAGDDLGCYIPQHQLLIYDLMTLEKNILASDAERVFGSQMWWSPDSDALIFRSYALGPSSRPGCDSEPDWTTAQFFLADLATGKVTSITGEDPRIAEWRTPGGAKGVAIRCDDPNQPGPSCEKDTQEILEIEGRVVDRGGPFAVLGWLP